MTYGSNNTDIEFTPNFTTVATLLPETTTFPKEAIEDDITTTMITNQNVEEDQGAEINQLGS